MVIDFHVHSFPDELAERAIPVLAKAAGIPARLDGTLADVKRSMKVAGIDLSVVQSIATKPSQTEKVNDWSAEIQEADVAAFGSIHPDYPSIKKELLRVQQLGLKGIKLHPEYQQFYVDEPRMYPMYEYAFSLGLIILFHAGVDIGIPPPVHCMPDRLLKLVRDFPEGKIVAAHMGGYRCWDEVEKLLVGTGIYFDTSMSIGRMSNQQAKRMLENHDPERVLFATDSPWADQAEEIARLKELELGTEFEEAILGKNAEKLLGL